jgi:regulator of nucleoside diphosphate kinase
MTALHAHPAIFIPAVDYDRLLAMAEGAARREPEVAEFLLRELGRASTIAPTRANRVVKMGSHIRFRDESTGRIRNVQLVYPAQADSAAGRISILTPIGAALIGLSVDQIMQWRDRTGKTKSLTILAVQEKPEVVA